MWRVIAGIPIYDCCWHFQPTQNLNLVWCFLHLRTMQGYFPNFPHKACLERALVLTLRNNKGYQKWRRSCSSSNGAPVLDMLLAAFGAHSIRHHFNSKTLWLDYDGLIKVKSRNTFRPPNETVQRFCRWAETLLTRNWYETQTEQIIQQQSMALVWRVHMKCKYGPVDWDFSRGRAKTDCESLFLGLSTTNWTWKTLKFMDSTMTRVEWTIGMKEREIDWYT